MNMREKIFKPFIQYKNNEPGATSGTGLGLTLSRTLAELHHGTLAMNDSELENNFILNLPIEQAEEIKGWMAEAENEGTNAARRRNAHQ